MNLAFVLDIPWLLKGVSILLSENNRNDDKNEDADDNEKYRYSMSPNRTMVRNNIGWLFVFTRIIYDLLHSESGGNYFFHE